MPATRAKRYRLRTVCATFTACLIAQSQSATGAMVFGDFNGDTFKDLAIGMDTPEGGEVCIIYGSVHDGLTSQGTRVLTLGTFGETNVNPVKTGFGSTLVVGDFDGDVRFDDLAIRSVVGDCEVEDCVGRVHIVFGSLLGLTGDRYTQLVGYDPTWGQVLAVGDFDGNRADDLAVGVPGYGGDAGTVGIAYFGANAPAGQIWAQGVEDISGVYEFGDHFGNRLAAGDFNRDGLDDLAIGVPSESFGEDSGGLFYEGNAGAVNVIYGSQDEGLRALNSQFLHQDHLGGDRENFDFFGADLVAAYASGHPRGVDTTTCCSMPFPSAEGFVIRSDRDGVCSLWRA